MTLAAMVVMTLTAVVLVVAPAFVVTLAAVVVMRLAAVVVVVALLALDLVGADVGAGQTIAVAVDAGLATVEVGLHRGLAARVDQRAGRARHQARALEARVDVAV